MKAKSLPALIKNLTKKFRFSFVIYWKLDRKTLMLNKLLRNLVLIIVQGWMLSGLLGVFGVSRKIRSGLLMLLKRTSSLYICVSISKITGSGF